MSTCFNKNENPYKLLGNTFVQAFAMNFASNETLKQVDGYFCIV